MEIKNLPIFNLDKTITKNSKTVINVASKYRKLEFIGEGAYGEVYKAINIHTNEIVAIKTTKLEDEEDGIPATTLR
jgi:serine/threonine protein kinase